MAPGANKKVANGLVTLSSAAIVAVYAAGFMRTKAAAEKMDEASDGRRPSMPAPPTAGERRTPDPIEPTTNPAQPTDMRSPMMAKPESTTAAAAPHATAPTNITNPTNQKGSPEQNRTNPTNNPGSTNLTNSAVQSSPEQNPANATNQTNPTNLSASAPSSEAAKPAEERKPDAPSNLLMPKEKYKDGTYLGWGTCRHGDIQAQVIITDGRISSASIAQCWTRYSCSWVSHLPGQVVARQSPDVDYVTGATQSANAFYWAIIDALSHAKAPSRPTEAPLGAIVSQRPGGTK